ncbi:MAG: LamG domain-containing protein, partial [Planctomycetes bacterium]|nr:LamG domain-containing protein [Planctomycetota bacterium]
GLLATDGVLTFSVFLGDKYTSAKSDKAVLQPGRWQHVAGVFDGSEVRVYVDGLLVARKAGKGARKANELPLLVGADPDGNGAPTSFFAGLVDDVRLSKVARYQAEFVPAGNHAADAETVLLLPCDLDFGPWTPDASGQGRHARRRGTAHCTLEQRPGVR